MSMLSSRGTLIQNQRKLKRPTKVQRSKPDLLLQVATLANDPEYWSSLNQWFPNPDKLVSSHGEEIELYDDVFFDPVGYADFLVRIGTLRGKEWCIEPPPDPSPEEQRCAEFIEKNLYDVNFDEIRGELLRSINYGYYGAEVIYQRSGNYIGVNKFIGKHPRRFTFTGNEDVRLLTRIAPTKGISLDNFPNKFIIMTYGDSGNPYGQGLGRTIWHFAWFKHGCIKFWMVYLERFGSPFLLGSYQDISQKDAILSVLQDLQQDSSAVVQGKLGDNIKFLEAQRSGTADYLSLCQYCDNQITRAILGQTLTSDVGQGGTGSRALGTIHNVVRQDILESDADLLDETLNATIIKWLADWNFNILPGRYPKLETHTQPKMDLIERARIDEILVTKIGLPISQEYFYQRYELPKPEKDAQLVVPPEVPKELSSSSVSFRESYTPEQNVVEHIVDSTITKAEHARASLVVQLKKLISEGRSIKEVQDNLFSQYADLSMDSIQRLIEDAVAEVQEHGVSVANEKVKELYGGK